MQLLERHFADLVDYQFTARMEDDLDRISTGEQEVVPYLSDFYFGDGHRGLTDLVARSLEPRATRGRSTPSLSATTRARPWCGWAGTAPTSRWAESR